MKQDEINDILKQEFNITDEHVKTIINNFWKGLRFYVVNPLKTKGRIMISNLLSLHIKATAVEKFIETMEKKEYKRISYQKQNLEFYKELLNLIKNERQAE